MRDNEEGFGGVGDPGEAAEVGEEGEGAEVRGGRRRDQMRRVEGERKLRKRVSLPHRAGYCMRRGGGTGGGAGAGAGLEFWILTGCSGRSLCQPATVRADVGLG